MRPEVFDAGSSTQHAATRSPHARSRGMNPFESSPPQNLASLLPLTRGLQEPRLHALVSSHSWVSRLAYQSQPPPPNPAPRRPHRRARPQPVALPAVGSGRAWGYRRSTPLPLAFSTASTPCSGRPGAVPPPQPCSCSSQRSRTKHVGQRCILPTRVTHARRTFLDPRTFQLGRPNNSNRAA